jgi:hypothetical protein
MSITSDASGSMSTLDIGSHIAESLMLGGRCVDFYNNLDYPIRLSWDRAEESIFIGHLPKQSRPTGGSPSLELSSPPASVSDSTSTPPPPPTAPPSSALSEREIINMLGDLWSRAESLYLAQLYRRSPHVSESDRQMLRELEQRLQQLILLRHRP